MRASIAWCVIPVPVSPVVAYRSPWSERRLRSLVSPRFVASTVFVLRRSLESLGPSFESFVVPFFPGLGYVANRIPRSCSRSLGFSPSFRLEVFLVSSTVCAS